MTCRALMSAPKGQAPDRQGSDAGVPEDLLRRLICHRSAFLRCTVAAGCPCRSVPWRLCCPWGGQVVFTLATARLLRSVAQRGREGRTPLFCLATGLASHLPASRPHLLVRQPLVPYLCLQVGKHRLAGAA